MEESSRPSAPTLLIDRFRALIDDNDIQSEDGGEIGQFYEEVLSELTFNSKPIITELTMIAGEQREYAQVIAHVICSRILEVPVDQKLPSLYLLDSIVKNIGREYVRYFAARLPKVFCEAYNQVHSSMHPAMRHLFGTWLQVFPSSVLRKIEEELQFSTPENQRPAGLTNIRHSESPSPRPSHGIHVNPKYLEARRHFEHSAAMREIDNQKSALAADFEEDHMDRLASESPKGWSGASPNIHEIQHVDYRRSQYGDSDFDHPEVRPSHLGKSKRGSPRTATARTSSMVGVEGPVNHLKVQVSRPLSPVDGRFQIDGSPWRVTERASPSHSRLGFGSGRSIDHNGWLARTWPSDVGAQQLEATAAYKPDNEYSRKHPRELIDAYGNYRGKDTSLELPKVRRLDVNGLGNGAMTKNWRSSEEEEYVWEEMSPTLADRSRRDKLPPFEPRTVSLSRRVGLTRPNAAILEPDFRGNGWPGETQLHPVDDPAIIADDRIPVLGPGHGSTNKKFPDGRESQNGLFRHYEAPHLVQEPGKFPSNFHSISQASHSSKSRGWVPHVPLRISDTTPSNSQKLPSPYDDPPDIDYSFQRLSGTHSDSLNVSTLTMVKPLSPPPAPVIWPPVHKSQPPPLLPLPPNQQQFRSPFDIVEANKSVVNQRPNLPMFLPQQQFGISVRITPNKVLQLPHQHRDPIHVTQQNQEQGAVTRIQSQDCHGSFIPPAPTHISSHLFGRLPNHVEMQGQGAVMGSVLPNSTPAMASSGAMHSSSGSNSFHVHGGILPPLPPGPPPPSSQLGPISQNTGSKIASSPASAYSGLFSTLMAQGLISLAPSAQPQDSLGVEFNVESLKVRHESAINSLYTNLPRQCTTCGLRFKCQEEHRNHMDWHVTKNRICKNRKQKPSRKWFVNGKVWLSGAETVGTDVPGFLPTEAVTEKKEDIELAVPADENQTKCELCGEQFEDFYSDETEEWMYRGAVYKYAPDGDVEGLTRSQLGPIVHAKCRSGSTEGS